MKVAHTSTTSTDHAQVTPSSDSSSALPRRTPGASGHTPQWGADDDKPVIPKLPGQRKPSGIGPRPPFPAQQLTARPLPRELAEQGWNDEAFERAA